MGGGFDVMQLSLVIRNHELNFAEFTICVVYVKKVWATLLPCFMDS